MTLSRSNKVEKLLWHGVLTSVQPRIRLSRSFDQRSHTYLGYALRDALPVADPRLETVEFYKVRNLEVTVREVQEEIPPPPWRGVPPPLWAYRERGHRRLAARTYKEKCTTCMWGCPIAVEMIIDQWNPSKRRYRTETFCYGPRSCPVYRSKIRNRGADSNGNASRNCCTTHKLVGCLVTLKCRMRRRS